MQDTPFDAPLPISFPPLFTGEAVSGSADPFTKACTRATLGCQSGLLVHNIIPESLRAAIVFAPEVPLADAMAVFCACGVGFQNALGALAPPEVAVHLRWKGEIVINGGTAGRLRVSAPDTAPDRPPDWLVVGFELQLIPQAGDGGDTPDQTSLVLEGCGDVSPIRLLESWSRHTLVWVNRLGEDGSKALHAEWRGLAHGIGDDVTVVYKGRTLKGTFLGIDEQFGMLIRDRETTHIVPLSTLLEKD